LTKKAFRTFASAALRRRFGITAFGLLGVLLCTGASSSTGCQSTNSGTIGPSKAEVGGAIAGVGVVIAVVVIVAVNHDHHLLSGCVYSDGGGVKLRTSNSQTYAIEGDPSAIKVGDMIKFHGSKVKKTGDSSGNQVFRIDQIKKDYGPCHITPPTPAAAP
jgi:hypothetical protein